MTEDAILPSPTPEEPTAVESSENVSDTPKTTAAAADADKPVDAVAEAVGEEPEAEEKEEAKPNDDTGNAPTDNDEGDIAVGQPSKKGDEKKAADENKENAAEPEAESSLGLDGTVDSKKTKKKTPATPGKATPKSASRKKSLSNLKNNNTPAKPKNADVKYEPGMQVLAKMRTFPPWPAVILSEELLPEALLKTRPSSNPKTKGSSTASPVERRHWPVIYMGTFEYSWINISNLDPLTPEKLATPPANIKNKGLVEAYNVAQGGFDLENVKELQASETMDVDSAESDAAEEEPEEGAESMDVDEPESEVEKPKKKAASKKRKLSVSDEEAEASEKPAKTPKKASAKAKTPKTARTPKAPKTPANGTAKAAAKPKASTAKKEKAAAPPKSAAKKKAPARSSKAKSAEKVGESDSEGEGGSSVVTKEEEKIDPSEVQLKQVKALRGRLQRGFLDKNKPPVVGDMADMAQKFDILETLQNQGIDAKVIKDTKINKVLKGIIKLSSIPADEKYNFKKRAGDLLAKMNDVLNDGEAAPVTEKTLAVGKEKDIKITKKPTEEKNGIKADGAAKESKVDSTDHKEKETEEEKPTKTASKKDDIEMNDTDEKETEGTAKAKVTEGEKESVEA